MSEGDGSGTHNVEPDRLLTIRELSELLRMAVGSCYHMVSQHRIPESCIVRLSRRCLRFREAEIWRWLESLQMEKSEGLRRREHGD